MTKNKRVVVKQLKQKIEKAARCKISYMYQGYENKVLILHPIV